MLWKSAVKLEKKQLTQLAEADCWARSYGRKHLVIPEFSSIMGSNRGAISHINTLFEFGSPLLFCLPLLGDTPNKGSKNPE